MNMGYTFALKFEAGYFALAFSITWSSLQLICFQKKKTNQFIVARREEHLQGATKVAPVFLVKSEASKKYIFQLSH